MMHLIHFSHQWDSSTSLNPLKWKISSNEEGLMVQFWSDYWLCAFCPGAKKYVISSNKVQSATVSDF